MIITCDSNKRIRDSDNTDTSSSTNTSNRTFDNSGNTVLITAVLTLVILIELQHKKHHSNKHTITAGNVVTACLPALEIPACFENKDRLLGVFGFKGLGLMCTTAPACSP